MKYKAVFIISFLIVTFIHAYILHSKVEPRVVKRFFPPVDKVSPIINLQQVSIKEPEPIVEAEPKPEPIVEPEVTKPEPIIEKAIPTPKKKKIKKKKKVVKKKRHKKKRVNKQTSSSQISAPKRKAIKDTYLAKVRRVIEGKKKYPKISKRRREEGTVYIQFTINKNGNIINIVLKKKSRYTKLNQAAMKILKEIGSFPSIPKEISKSSLTITVPIKYNIKT
ncbi:MAG: TonB family protein [Campylobacterota bacterium]|nr:TonB family protein [Campylobacterota bacterium]